MPLTLSATRERLAALAHEPKRFLGQNFLVDGNIVRKSLALGQVGPGDEIVEIGPGLGTLTEALLQSGAEVWAVEKDRTLAAHLAETLAQIYPGKFHLLEGDAIEHPLAEALAGSLRLKIIANLPYAIATPWLDAVLGGNLPIKLVLMLQKEAAERYAARPGTKSFGAISIFLQSAYRVEPGHRVSPECFYPRPIVDSYLLPLTRLESPFVFPTWAKEVIRQLFQQRRKQIGALLRQAKLGDIGGELLLQQGLSEKMRPEELPLAWWQALAQLPPPA